MTQVDMVKKHIEDEGSITSLDAFRDYGITRLSDVIFKIRRQCGWTIETDIVTGKNRFGGVTHFGVYRRHKCIPFGGGYL